jgi:glutaminyl-peptide cyclotransferase
MHKRILCLTLVLGCIALGCAETPAAKPNASEAVGKPATQKPSSDAPTQTQHIDAKRAMQYVREIVAFGRRAPGSPGMAKQQAYLRAKLKGDNLEEDSFKKKTPVGEFQFTNFIAKFPGTTNDVIVIASHYDTPYALKNFVGANDGGSSMALLLELANQFRGKKRAGPAIWLVWLDGEESVFEKWSDPDSLYGSRHLAEKWKQDGTAKRVKAFILTDMIGDADLNIDHDANSTRWLSELVYQAATNLSKKSYFYARDTAIDDDHIAFLKAGMPAVDIIDLDYGYNNVYHHSPEDTIDKLSVNSMQIAGDVVLETVRLLGSGAHQTQQ